MSQAENEKAPEISVLITYTGHNRIGKVNLGCGFDDIRRVCLNTFTDMLGVEESFTIKHFNEEWDVWVDVGHEFTLEKKQKFCIGMKKRLTTIVESLKARKHLKEQEDEGTIRKKKAQISVQFGWQHNKSQGNRKQFTQVRAGNGSGVATVKLDRNSSYDNVMEKAKEIFFPGGVSLKHGPAEKLDFHLSNFRGQQIEEESFSLDDLYQEAGSRLRMYLMSNPKSATKLFNSLDANKSDSSSSEDIDLPNPFLDPIIWDRDIPGPSGCVKTTPNSSGTPTVQFNQGCVKTMTCGICYDDARARFFIPCGHSLCQSCGERIFEGEEKMCPFCKTPIEKLGTLY